jgi:hypothetical protein
MNRLVPALEEHTVLAWAAEAGYRLVQYETDTGQLIWGWRHGDGPRPQFVTRRIAIHWITQLLERDHGAPFVSSAGMSYARHLSGEER